MLYAIQGTGNGHLSRATDIIPLLQQYGEVDILLSGRNSDVTIPFDIHYRLSGLSFVFGKKGDIEFIETIRQTNLRKLWNEISNLPVQDFKPLIQIVTQHLRFFNHGVTSLLVLCPRKLNLLTCLQ